MHKLGRRQAVRLVGMATAMLGAPALVRSAGAQAAWPDRPIRIVVPYPPGGSTDPVARLLAAELQTRLGQPVVVENRAGAAGSIGTESVTRAAPDGSTFLFHTSVLATEPSFKQNLPYNVLTDLVPVSLLVTGPYLLVVNPTLPARDVGELIAYARANPGKVNFGSAGTGSSGHLIGELFALQARTQMVHVPYRGGGPSVTALMQNDIQFIFDTIPGSRGLVEDGKLRALAVTSAERAPLLPQVPTIGESGLPDFANEFWLGLMAPARLPAPIQARMAEAVRGALAEPGLRDRLLALGMVPRGLGPEEFGATLRRDIAAWRDVIQRANIRAE
ncbi:tripartite tricarboxylate transporter substrate binding protein [Roseomonas frigidaquae]|uniref:Tripartite tricarboxylate transporter substrate binding protein n=1 Tax=Falsiroseomonas frigidaquae TaxID=487318 RepID=A0ABX1EW62_9PROT|nr:tripartite tricarboxylate transporter substrate binding protein [Falsiroseomonas frigidaquae]NKE43865.1 tripartite tricarboxylate transporter substrate binding protein [Falsiroseomonas frigidaquae]